MWRFHIGNSERIINPQEGPTLEPFRHDLVHYNNSNMVKSMSLLHIPLLNSSLFTNYTLMNVNDMCQLTVRVHLQETALSYINNAYSFGMKSASSPHLTSILVLAVSTSLMATKWLLSSHR